MVYNLKLPLLIAGPSILVNILLRDVISQIAFKCYILTMWVFAEDSHTLCSFDLWRFHGTLSDRHSPPILL